MSNKEVRTQDCIIRNSLFVRHSTFIRFWTFLPLPIGYSLASTDSLLSRSILQFMPARNAETSGLSKLKKQYGR